MKLREYETVIVLDPELSEAEIEKVLSKFEEIIKKHNGIIKEIEKWGIKTLAFKVKHKRKGYYAVFHYYGRPETIEEVERNIKIDDRIIRFLSFKTSKKEIDSSQIEVKAA